MHEIEGHTRVCGLIGHPVGHTFSPLIHNTLSKETGTNLVYVPFDVESAGAVRDAVFGAYGLNILGLNVTVPYKEVVMDALRDVDETARAIGAVNTLVRVDGGYKGYNTDYIGLYRALVRGGVKFPRSLEGDGSSGASERDAMEGSASNDVAPNENTGEGKAYADDVTETVVIVGAGGAARAAGFVAGKTGVKNLVILNRTISKARDLAEDIQKNFPEMNISVMPLSGAGSNPYGRYVAIQCTKVGLAPNEDESPITDPAFYEKLTYAYDCIYNPENTKFLQLAREAGATGDCGLYMLLYQGVAAYELWNATSVPDIAVDIVVEKFRELLSKQ